MVWSFFLCPRHLWPVLSFFAPGICVHPLSFTAFSAVGIRVRLFVFALVCGYQCTSQFLASCSALAARQTSGGPRGQPASMLCSMDWRLTNGWHWFWLCLAWLRETCLVCDFVVFFVVVVFPFCVGLSFVFLSFFLLLDVLRC